MSAVGVGDFRAPGVTRQAGGHTIHGYLEEGVDHARVEVDAGGDELVEPDATTRHQIGLAAVLELKVPTAARA